MMQPQHSFRSMIKGLPRLTQCLALHPSDYRGMPPIRKLLQKSTILRGQSRRHGHTQRRKLGAPPQLGRDGIGGLIAHAVQAQRGAALRQRNLENGILAIAQQANEGAALLACGLSREI